MSEQMPIVEFAVARRNCPPGQDWKPVLHTHEDKDGFTFCCQVDAFPQDGIPPRHRFAYEFPIGCTAVCRPGQRFRVEKRVEPEVVLFRLYREDVPARMGGLRRA